MNVKIQKIISSSTPRPVVEFTSEFGAAEASWCGKKVSGGEQVDVELSISDILRTEVCNDSGRYRLQKDLSSGTITVVGCVEEVDAESRVVVVRFGEDIVQVEADCHGLRCGNWVEFSCGKLSLYEVSY